MLSLGSAFQWFQDPAHSCRVSPAKPGILSNRLDFGMAIIKGSLALDLITNCAGCDVGLVWEVCLNVFREMVHLVIAALSSILPIFSSALVDLRRHPGCRWQVIVVEVDIGLRLVFLPFFRPFRIRLGCFYRLQDSWSGFAVHIPACLSIVQIPFLLLLTS